MRNSRSLGFAWNRRKAAIASRSNFRAEWIGVWDQSSSPGQTYASVLPVGVVVMNRGVQVGDSLSVEAAVHPVVSGLQGGPELPVALGLRTGGDGVDVGQGALDLLQEVDRIDRREKLLAVDADLDGARVGGDVAGAAAQAA